MPTSKRDGQTSVPPDRRQCRLKARASSCCSGCSVPRPRPCGPCGPCGPAAPAAPAPLRPLWPLRPCGPAALLTTPTSTLKGLQTLPSLCPRCLQQGEEEPRELLSGSQAPSGGAAGGLGLWEPKLEMGKRPEQTPRRVTRRWRVRMRKERPHHMSSGKREPKQHPGAAARLVSGPNPER